MRKCISDDRVAVVSLQLYWLNMTDVVFRLIGQRSRLRLGLTAIRRGYDLYDECLLVCVSIHLQFYFNAFLYL